jgi:hypothetical protein
MSTAVTRAPVRGDVAGAPAGPHRDVEHLLARPRAQPLRGVRQGIRNREADIVIESAARAPHRGSHAVVLKDCVD